MQTPSRAVLLVLGTLGAIVLAAVPAAAETPAEWAEPANPMSWLDAILLFGGSTVGLIVIISLFALLTARNNYTPPPPSKEIQRPHH